MTRITVLRHTRAREAAYIADPQMDPDEHDTHQASGPMSRDFSERMERERAYWWTSSTERPGFKIPLEDGSVDLIFAFDAAHHFGAHRRTLAEIRRVLQPGGVCLYLHEPTVSKLLYRPAVERVNKKRAGFGRDVAEDVIVGGHLLSIAHDLGFVAHRTFAPSLHAWRSKERVYYTVVRRRGSLQRLLPSTADLVFTKRFPGRAEE